MPLHPQMTVDSIQSHATIHMLDSVENTTRLTLSDRLDASAPDIAEPLANEV
jgi:hypothetical protein